ncbi:ROK family protein [Alkalibacterium kapii]|uniref:N-acetylmannosamine kinase n=1 Tax=Alkalibacterium kapii TaxID=426704 RepID=A0A511AWG4_9LACT|nr:ROK family protein [Alkalibacterium kapii]GEK91992.1 N-acetylmannosamine kinase [Alkalibacterium kapii]
MAILTFDIGGTSVKHGVWNKDQLVKKDSFKTPKTWDEMKEKLTEIKEKTAHDYRVEGIALSSPGAVNQATRQIEGISAVSYLHLFPIYDELEELFDLPIAIENDANCAALAEVWKGSAEKNDNVLFVVVGTGIGGAVIVNKKIHHGAHMFGGEFGCMLLNGEKTFSELATAVNMARRYADQKELSYDDISGKQVFELAEKGDKLAINEVNNFYYFLAKGLYNLAYAFDPEKIIIGGGISSMDGFIERLNREFEELLKRVECNTFHPKLDLCTFRNDANLIGAVYNYLQKSHKGN